MEAIILLIHVVIAIALIGLVLLQQGKGAQMGAAFGSGASNTLFGSRGPASFLMKLTAVLIALFFITSIVLGRMAAQDAKARSQIVAPTTQTRTIAPPKHHSTTSPAKTTNTQQPILPPVQKTK